MSTSPRETSVRRAVLAYLKTLGPQVCYRSNPATPYGVTGDPDLMVCVGGQLVCIELKRPGWRPTPGWQASPQGRRLRKWAEAGAIVLVAWNRASVQEMMETLLGRSRTEVAEMMGTLEGRKEKTDGDEAGEGTADAERDGATLHAPDRRAEEALGGDEG